MTELSTEVQKALATLDAPKDQKAVIVDAGTPNEIARLKGFMSTVVTDIHSKAQRDDVHDRRMQCVRFRRGVEKWRTDSNEDLQAQIKKNNAKAKLVKDAIEPVETFLENLQEQVEKDLEAERVAKANKVYADRVAKLAEVGSTVSEGVLRTMGDETFNEFLMHATAQKAEREKLAAIEEQQRIEREKLAKEQEERDRLAQEQLEAEQAAERQRQEEARLERERLATEEAERLRAEKEKLEADRAEFQRQQTEAAERDRLAREAAEKEAQQKRAAEEERLKAERESLARQLLDLQAKQRAQEDEQARLDEERRKLEEARNAPAEPEEEPHDAEALDQGFTPVWELADAAEQAADSAAGQWSCPPASDIFEDHTPAVSMWSPEIKKLADELNPSVTRQVSADEHQTKLERMQPDINKLHSHVTMISGLQWPAVGEDSRDVAKQLQDVSGAVVAKMQEMLDSLTLPVNSDGTYARWDGERSND